MNVHKIYIKTRFKSGSKTAAHCKCATPKCWNSSSRFVGKSSCLLRCRHSSDVPPVSHYSCLCSETFVESQWWGSHDPKCSVDIRGSCCDTSVLLQACTPFDIRFVVSPKILNKQCSLHILCAFWSRPLSGYAQINKIHIWFQHLLWCISRSVMFSSLCGSSVVRRINIFWMLSQL